MNYILKLMKNLWIYILITSRGHFYTGWTTDLKRRFREHESGKNGAKYTRAFKAQKIAMSWSIQGSRSDALRIEAFIKKQSRKKKQEYIDHPERLNEELIQSGNEVSDEMKWDTGNAV